MSETALIARLRVAASSYGAVLLRNTSGYCVCGSHPLRYGVPPTGGGADLIGWTRSGRLLVVEAKTGRQTPTVAQHRFLFAVAASGGLAVVAHTVADLTDRLRDA